MKKTIYILIAISFLSCKSAQRVVEIEKEVTKTEYRDRIHRDSIFVSDSVIVQQKGDTVKILDKRFIYKDRLIRDTITRVDSFYTEKPVYVEVPAKLTKWQQWKLKYFNWLMLSVVLILIYSLRKPIAKLIRSFL